MVGHPSLPYKLLVAKALVASLAPRLAELPEGAELTELGVFKGSEIQGTAYRHPLAGRTSKVVLGGDYITTDSGTVG